MKFEVDLEVMPKAGISDPQGLTIERALPRQGFDGIHEVRVGKRISFVVEAADEDSARSLIEDAAQKILHNPVIEDFEYRLRVAEGVR
ncbi:MAG: phosphoribosylformylglycinamidine synthase subunit PurS [Actinomycetota bacterium]